MGSGFYHTMRMCTLYPALLDGMIFYLVIAEDNNDNNLMRRSCTRQLIIVDPLVNFHHLLELKSICQRWQPEKLTPPRRYSLLSSCTSSGCRLVIQ